MVMTRGVLLDISKDAVKDVTGWARDTEDGIKIDVDSFTVKIITDGGIMARLDVISEARWNDCVQSLNVRKSRLYIVLPSLIWLLAGQAKADRAATDLLLNSIIAVGEAG